MNFEKFYEWVYKEFKINLLAYKEVQLNRRIQNLMTKLGMSNLEEYSKLLKENYEERQRFLDYITINVTEFYRNPELYKELNDILKKRLEETKMGLKVWSAACSIGCEPYTVAMILKEINPRLRHRIIATDIDETILKRASEGIYTKNEMRSVEKNIENKYFNKVLTKYHISNEIKSLVTFKRHDLIMDSYDKNYDLILCRNVVIYFKNEVKKEIFKKFSEALKPGGLLFVGATESIYNSKEYGLYKESTFIYRKM
ncbi:MAG: CheR family methyltransferase [Clostridium sp.]|uniref:CheR family methyltransferase n=1 Tax=Clostridium sp. TaxID=1506 RepID=UPI003F334801